MIINSGSGSGQSRHVSPGSSINRGWSRNYQGSGGSVSHMGFNYSDDDYLSMIEKYKDNPEFYNYLLTNPYMWSKQGQFSPNLMQQLAVSFGDTSSEDNYINQINSLRQEWFSEAYKKFYEQDYNSAVSQVAREREAGLNPDLSGNISPGDAAENDQPIGLAPSSGYGSEDSMRSIANFGINLVSSVMSFASQIQSFKAMKLDNDARSVSLHSSALDLLTKELENTISVPDDFDWSDSDKVDEVILDSAGKIDWSSYPRSLRRMMRSYSSSLRKNAETNKEPAKLRSLRERLANEILGSRISRAEKLSHSWYSDDITEMAKNIGEITSRYSDKMSELSFKIARAQAKSADVSAEVSDKTKSSTIEVINQTNETSKLLARQQELSESMYNEVYEYLKSDKSGTLGKIGLVIFPFLRQLASSLAGSSFSFGSKHVSGGTHDIRDVYLNN